MVEPRYIPVLPTSWNALKAYEQLTPEARLRTAPLWTIPPRTGPMRSFGHRPPVPYDPDPEELTKHLRKTAVNVMRAHRSTPGWVDAFHVEDERGPVTAGLWRHLHHSPCAR
ncbi:hypothetical protein NKH77_11265 [Streptomyces sp. M19]